MFSEVIKAYSTKRVRRSQIDSSICSLEGILGNVFLSKEMRQREQIVKAHSEIDVIKTKCETDLGATLKDRRDRLVLYKKHINKISDDLNGKRFSTTAYNDLKLDDEFYKFRCIRASIDNIPKEISVAKKLLVDDTIKSAPEYIKGCCTGHFFFDDPADDDMTSDGDTLSRAGYKPDFITYAFSTVPIFEHALEDMEAIKSSALSWLEKRKLLVTMKITQVEINHIVSHSRAVVNGIDGIFYYLLDDNLLSEISHMAWLYFKYCYE